MMSNINLEAGSSYQDYMSQSKKNNILVGDIGNTETKLCVVSKNNKILKKITFLSKSVNNNQLNRLFKKKMNLELLKPVIKKKDFGFLKRILDIFFPDSLSYVPKKKNYFSKYVGVNIFFKNCVSE